MIEMLLVGVIVLAATFYSTWALMPAPPGNAWHGDCWR